MELKEKKMCWVSWDRMTAPKALGGLGLRDIQLFNQALLAKLAWRIITVPDCLLARILKGKYCQRTSFLDANLPSTCSHGWRSILFGRDLLKENLGKAIGNGQTTRVWKDSWISLEEDVRPLGPQREEDMDLMVSDLLTTDMKWNGARLKEILPMMSKKILCIQPRRSGVEDRFIWQPLPSGVYSTRSGYFSAAKKARIPSVSTCDDFKWLNDVWRSSCSPKLRLFLWSIINNALPIGENLQNRGMISATNCPRCNEKETKMHIFFTCPFAKEVWNLVPISHAVHIAAGMDFTEALTRFRRTICLPPTVVVGAIVPWIVWSLWLSRNTLIFEDKKITPEETTTKGLRLALEWNQAQRKEITNSSLPEESRDRVHTTSDNSPMNGSTTCKTDAAWDKNRKRAGLAWNFSGPTIPSPVEGSLVQDFIASPLVAEALALLTALGSAKDLGITKLEVFSDCATLIGATNGRIQSKELIGIVSDI